VVFTFRRCKNDFCDVRDQTIIYSKLKIVILYGKNNQKRILSFELGKVNIITGESKNREKLSD